MDHRLLFLVFFVMLTGIIGSIQWFIFRRYKRWISQVAVPQRIPYFRKLGLGLLLTGNALLMLQIAVRMSGMETVPAIRYSIVYPAGFFLATILLLFLILLISADIRLLFTLFKKIRNLILEKNNPSDSKRIDNQNDFNPGRRRFLKWSGISLAGLSLTLPPLGALTSTRNYLITRIPLYFKNLPAGLEGFTIAQISDIHSGIYMSENEIREIFDLANSLTPNLIALTGDFVDSSDTEIPAIHRAVSMLKADYGVYGCLGNHDHYATAEKVTAALQQQGIIILNNAHQTLKINGENLSLIGVDDAGFGRQNFADLGKAIRGLEPETFRILLSHQPNFFPKARAAGMDLTLSGHTHGGQVGIEWGPVKINPVYLVYHYARGLYNEGDQIIYVNSGVGMVGVPIRLIRPEISLFTLHRG